jgi:hypothetical protein
MTMSLSRDQAVELVYAHAKAEAEGDLEATLATLEDAPVYELQPVGLVLPGMDLARRFYEYFFSDFTPLIAGYTIRQEWLTDGALGHEYTIWTRTGPDRALERHEIIGVPTFGTTRMSGERLYASDRLLRLMFGPVLDEARPIVVGEPPAA